MSLMKKRLSSLKNGSRVRITHNGGHIFEGVVSENDGEESLAIQITSYATLRYDQISVIEEIGQAEPANYVQSEQTVHAENTENADEKTISNKTTSEVSETNSSIPNVMHVVCDKDTVSACFKAMNSDEKKALTPAHDKFQSYLKSHEQSKCREAVDLIWEIMGQNEWDYNQRVNSYYAQISYIYGDIYNASISFFYGGDFRMAYCTAYHTAKANKDMELYKLAAAFSAVYLIKEDEPDITEAMRVLKKSSTATSDISGIEYVFNNTAVREIESAVRDVTEELALKYIGHSQDDTGKLLRKLANKYTKNDILREIKDYLGKLLSYTEDEPTEYDETEFSEISEQETAEPVVTVTVTPTDTAPDLTKEYEGKITKYKFLEDMGFIETENEQKYPFDIKDISDQSLLNQVKKISSRNFSPIAVLFMIEKRAGKYVAVSIKRRLIQTVKQFVAKDPMIQANGLYAKKKYEKAIEQYRTLQGTENWETAFTQIILCYLALWNENGDMGYSQELNAFIDTHIDENTQNPKTLEVLQQYYMRIQDYSKCIDVLNKLMELCDYDEHGRILHYLIGKGRCYRFLKDYPSAISQFLDWLDIFKKNNMLEHKQQRDTIVYIELAEVYFENGDYEEAEKYANLCVSADRKRVLLNKLAALQNEVEEDDEYPEFDDEDDDFEGESDFVLISAEPTETLQNAYDAYQDEYGFDALDVDDNQIFSKALNFKPNQLHCVLTYLKAASKLASQSIKYREYDDGTTVYFAHTIPSVCNAFAYAFNSPLSEKSYVSTEIISVFEETKELLPEINGRLLASATMHALFSNPSVPDYSQAELISNIGKYDLSQYPSLMMLLEYMLDFREKTGFGMDIYADYRTSSSVINNIIAEAAECCRTVDMKNDVFENQGQVRRMREFMFSSTDSELRKCLDIVVANDVLKYAYVKNTMSELFIRTNKNISTENIDIKKIDKYIDKYWDLARDVIQNEGRHVARPHDKIKGSKRNNVIISMRRIISCICDWLEVAEHSGNDVNDYVKRIYDDIVFQVTSCLKELVKACEVQTEKNGFDWGTESIRKTAQDILGKIDGTYNSKTRKYMFIDFLSDEEILLGSDYLPEIQSTFCGMSDFNILKRIERHAEKKNLSFSERISEIFSDSETKHNFRSAELIKKYGEDMSIDDITEHKDFSHYSECLKQARLRFETMYRDFADELELCESYGKLSNINGEKDRTMRLAYEWYCITRQTTDYGFYARLLENIRNRISADASAKGERLTKQLEELSDKTGYDFGVYDKKTISALIEDQNYSSAEFILNCIRSGDTKAVADYSAEPFGYFSEFINEHATNHRAVCAAGKSLADTIFAYSGKKDLKKALAYITNNAHKETNGGAKLLRNWLPIGGPANNDIIEGLLSMLGFKPERIQQDTSTDTEAYHVFCRKQAGKVNYNHRIPAFGSLSEQEGFRVLCLYGKYDCDSLMDKFRSVNTTAKHTLVLLDFALVIDERRKLARKIKEEKSFSKTFVLIDRVILFYLARHYAENTIIRRLMAVTLPFSYYQPFVESSNQNMPPELFTGREAELTNIEAVEGANLVYGGRQLGKSALLKMAQRNIDKNGNGDRAVLVDIKDRNYTDAARIVSNELIISGILDESCQCEDWEVLASHIKKRLLDENPETRINYLLLMLDEADEFIRTSVEDGNPPISALKNLPAGRFKIVMAGLHNLSRYNREMMHANSNLIHLNSVVIKQFRREEAIKLLTNILAYLGFRFNEKIISTILATTNYYPGLIQFYCQKLLEAMKSEDYAGYNEIRTPNYEVTENHFKKVLSDRDFMEKVNEKLEATLFTEEKGHSHYHILALIFAFLYYTDPNDKGYTTDDIMKIANDYNITRIISLKPEQLKELLNEMWDLNVLTSMEEYYSFATEGFRNLLGSQEKVEQSMSEYFGEGEKS